MLGLVQVPLAASSTPAGRTFCSDTGTTPLLDSQPLAILDDSRHSRPGGGRSRAQRSIRGGGQREWLSRSSDGADPDDGRGVAAGGQLVGRGRQKPNHGDHDAEVENTGRFRRGTRGLREFHLFSLGWRSPSRGVCAAGPEKVERVRGDPVAFGRGEAAALPPLRHPLALGPPRFLHFGKVPLTRVPLALSLLALLGVLANPVEKVPSASGYAGWVQAIGLAVSRILPSFAFAHGRPTPRRRTPQRRYDQV